MLFQPHFVREYRRLVRTLVRQYDRDAAMEKAVGGEFDKVGAAQAAFLRDIGLGDTDYLIDVGCGAGRTAFALRNLPSLRYQGTDVVPELLAYAREKSGRRDWKFTLVNGLSIPERDGQADMVSMFSVLTHLTPQEGFAYLTDAVRVVRPGGLIVVSFLDHGIDCHRELAGNWVGQIVNRVMGGSVKNVVIAPEQMARWGETLGLDVRLFGTERVGQSCCVFTKRAQALPG